MKAADVYAGNRLWSVEQADCLSWLASLPADSVDILLGSPPYEQARLYLENGQNLGVARNTETWVAWMVQVYQAALRVCKGVVAFVVEGQTQNYRYSCGPALLMADLCRAGVNLRRPVIFHRVGIPGSGGPDWLRGDTEWIICATRPGKLPWSDNTACGHPPKWAPGGEMSHRLSDGARVNQWGKCGDNTIAGVKNGNKESTTGNGRRPSHQLTTKRGRRVTSGHKDGDTPNSDSYDPPAKANPGNTMQQLYTADDVAALLDQAGDIVHCKVGGGLMGHQLAHENEAPFPLALAEFFVRSFCPPGGICCDVFSGSGTTAHAAILHGRRFVGCDLRESQVQLTRKRLETVTPMLPTG